MAVKNPEKTVFFYRYWLYEDGQKRAVSPLDWRKLLADWDKGTFSEKCLSGVYCLPVLTERFPALGLHKEIDGAFQTFLHQGTATIEDVLDSHDGDQDKIRANSTAVAFIPGTTFVAVCRGNTSAPGAKVLELLLASLKPLGPSVRWAVEPVLDSGKLQEFKKVDGIRKAEISITTAKDLFNDADGDDGIVGTFDYLAQQVGGELKISMSIELLPSDAQKRNVRQKMSHFVEKSLPRIIEGRKAKVLPVAADQTEGESLDLLAHKFAKKTQINTEDLDSKTFMNLVHATVDVTFSCQNELNQLI